MKRFGLEFRKLGVPRIRKKSPPGSAPGHLAKRETAEPPKIQLIQYSESTYHEVEVDSFAALKEKLDPNIKRTWINVWGFNDELLGSFGKHFGLHSLALEDVNDSQQRAKIETYDEHVYIVLRMVTSPDDPRTEQISLFLFEGLLITFQESAGDCLHPVRNRLKNQGSIVNQPVGYLAYAIIDAVIDVYFPILERFADVLDKLEATIIKGGEDLISAHLHEIKSELLLLQRIIFSHRDLVNSITRKEPKQFSGNTVFYLRDCHDHTLQQTDLVETYRDMSSNLMDLFFSVSNKRTGDVMKVLTIVASIFIPLTFIAGIYGMNFRTERSPWNMPELDWYFGYPFALGLMVSVALALLIYFKRKGWL